MIGRFMDPARYVPGAPGTRALMRIETIPPEPGEPDPRARDYWERRELTPSFDFRDVWGEEHIRAFTAAKLMEEDVLRSVRNRLAEALAEGQTYEQWRNNIEGELEKLGWWREREVQDPQDPTTIVKVNVPQRTRIIFDTNMRVARAVGQWDRIQETKDILPYLTYQLGPSERHRPLHVSWAGTTLHADDQWWDTHTPPNGWNCKCHIRQVSQTDFDRRPKSQTTRPPLNVESVKNTRTGRTHKVPKGIDPGFEYNPGAAALTEGLR